MAWCLKSLSGFIHLTIIYEEPLMSHYFWGLLNRRKACYRSTCVDPSLDNEGCTDRQLLFRNEERIMKTRMQNDWFLVTFTIWCGFTEEVTHADLHSKQEVTGWAISEPGKDYFEDWKGNVQRENPFQVVIYCQPALVCAPDTKMYHSFALLFWSHPNANYTWESIYKQEEENQ